MEQVDIETAQRIDAEVNGLVETFEARVDALGVVAARLYPVQDGGSDDGKTQMNNLERVGLSAARFGDVVTFVKRQTGRMKQWSGGGANSFGVQLVTWLGELHGEVLQRCEDPLLAPHRQAIALRVVGTSMRNLNSAFLYARVAVPR